MHDSVPPVFTAKERSGDKSTGIWRELLELSQAGMTGIAFRTLSLN